MASSPTTPARTRPDGRSGVRSASSASARSICASTKGWERFVTLGSTGKLQCSPSTRSMPKVDARGRPSTAPAARTRSLPTLRAAPEGKTSDVFDLTSVSEPSLQSPDEAEPRSDGASQSRDVVTIEYCTVQRPTMTLRGTPEEFAGHALALKAFLEDTFPSVTVKLQKPPYSKRLGRKQGGSAHTSAHTSALARQLSGSDPHPGRTDLRQRRRRRRWRRCCCWRWWCW